MLCYLQFDILFCPFCNIFLLVSLIIVSKLQAIFSLAVSIFGFLQVFHLPTCILQVVLYVRSEIL